MPNVSLRVPLRAGKGARQSPRKRRDCFGSLAMTIPKSGARTSTGAERGFTLIEVVVAMAILSIGLTVLMELFSGGLRLGRTSGEYSRAVNLGRMKMEEIMTQQNIEEGTDEGKFDDTYRWQVDMKKVDILPQRSLRP